ncbi:MAG: hypothetical protein ABI854_02730 [Betaproteobacteria bacterium]
MGEQQHDPEALASSLRATMATLVAERAPRPEIATIKQRVRRWQNRRFAHTYRDLARNPRYRAAIDFFLSELYGDSDMTARDTDMARILPMMIKVLPAVALQTVRDSLAFEALSERLDTDLAAQLGSRVLDDTSYGEAFRACGRRADRESQIRCVSEIGHALDRMTRWPLIRTTLRLMRVPAGAAGLSTLQAFLEGGYAAFREMHGAEEFLATIARRETVIVERLFAGHPRPFELEDTL